MKAPNEIYIYREPPKDYFEDGWGESKVDDMESIPYIRKDAILEILKGEKKWMELFLQKKPKDKGSMVKKLFCEALINHIESL